MASSSSSPFPASSWKYDVFISFRGKDTRKTFVDHLYSALAGQVSVYKDDVTLPRGDTIDPSLFNAIEESQIAVIVFSENYADSSWCLDELVHIMKCRDERGLTVIPIFYDVDPSDVRRLKRKYGEAFSKHELSENNYQKIKSWKKALIDASNIAGWEPKHIANGHEAVGIKIIVGTIQDKLLSVISDVDDEEFVGMGSRCQHFESLLNKIGPGGVRMIGIWGVGGGGKTTLAHSIYIKIRKHFDGHCFIENIREKSAKHGLENLQEEILSKVLKPKVPSQVLKTKVSVASVQEGKHMIKSMLCRRNVLIVLDDVAELEQLEALAGSLNWFGDGSRIIITTRDEQVLISHRVDVYVSPVRLLSHDEAIRLFKRVAYHEEKPVEDYDELSLRVISYVDGLPLALKILGSFLYGRDKNAWMSALDKLKHIPPSQVMDQLKISYEGLEDDEKELFLDIACFFKGTQKDEAIVMLDACGFNPGIGVDVLKQKCLITFSSDGKFDMHDMIQEMGHNIVREENPKDPEKRSRLWRKEDIEDICSGNATTTENDKIEAIGYDGPLSSRLPKFVSNVKNLRLLYVRTSHYGYYEGPTFLSNELRSIYWVNYASSPFPESFQPKKLGFLHLFGSYQEELWNGYKLLPKLKVLELYYAPNLFRTPNFNDLPCLEKLTLSQCESLEEIHASLGSHTRLVYVSVKRCDKLTRFPTIVRMEKLEILEISYCKAFLEFPKIEASMDNLVDLHLEGDGIEVIPSSVGEYCTNLISLKLMGCTTLKRIEGNFHALKRLQKFVLHCPTQLETLPRDLFDEESRLKELHFSMSYLESSILPRVGPHLPCLLRKLNLSFCELRDGEIPSVIGELSNLQELDLSENKFSRLDISLSQLPQLKLLNLSRCDKLVELPVLPSSLAILKAYHCGSLETISDDIHINCKWLCQVSITGGGSINGGERLLESMLQGKSIEKRCMSLHLQGLEIPKGFEPRLLSGMRCRLQLPENWFSEYTGFLLCAVLTETIIFYDHSQVKINMKHEGGSMGMGSQYDVSWVKDIDDIITWVVYIPFHSLRKTAWWDQKSIAVEFSIDLRGPKIDKYLDETLGGFSGFGAKLISKINRSGQMEETTTDSSSDFSDAYNCNFQIEHDAKSALECRFNSDEILEELWDKPKILVTKAYENSVCNDITDPDDEDGEEEVEEGEDDEEGEDEDQAFCFCFSFFFKSVGSILCRR